MSHGAKLERANSLMDAHAPIPMHQCIQRRDIWLERQCNTPTAALSSISRVTDDKRKCIRPIDDGCTMHAYRDRRERRSITGTRVRNM